MKTVHTNFTVAAMLVALMSIAASPNGDRGIHLTGLDGKTTDWTTAKLKQQFAATIKSIDYTSKSGKHQSHCIALLDVLKTAGIDPVLKMNPTMDPKTKNYNLRLAVVVQGDDGYTATFSLGELLPEIGRQNVWIALDQDDQPLTAKEGVAKLIVPDDAKPARWIHAVASILVVDPTKVAATQPASN